MTIIIIFLQLAMLCTIAVAVIGASCRLYKDFRTKRRLAKRVAEVFREHPNQVSTDEQSLERLREQLETLLVKKKGLLGIEEMYSSRLDDASLEMTRLFATAFRRLEDKDRQNVEEVLEKTSAKGKMNYLRDAFVLIRH
jgi:hypothetical protein